MRSGEVVSHYGVLREIGSGGKSNLDQNSISLAHPSSLRT
jgi:hypothetical protein